MLLLAGVYYYYYYYYYYFTETCSYWYMSSTKPFITNVFSWHWNFQILHCKNNLSIGFSYVATNVVCRLHSIILINIYFHTFYSPLPKKSFLWIGFTWVSLDKFETHQLQGCLVTLVLLNPDIPCLANSVDPDQLASEEASWSGSALFAIKYVNS